LPARGSLPRPDTGAVRRCCGFLRQQLCRSVLLRSVRCLWSQDGTG
jgi:hypothetical protein